MSKMSKTSNINYKLALSSNIHPTQNVKYCNNCGLVGHIYKDCNKPITSFGVICYMDVEGDGDCDDNGVTFSRKFLMIRRKDSLGYVDFMRGRYNIYNKNHIQNLIDEMTIHEKEQLLTRDFYDLWNELWGETRFNKFKQEEQVSFSKLKHLKSGVYSDNLLYTLETLIQNSKTNWTEPEWEFPKGRRNNNEYDINTAVREFSEETGIDKHSISLFRNIEPYIENYTGSNYKSYKHVYYLAKYKKGFNFGMKREPSQTQPQSQSQSQTSSSPTNDIFSHFQKEEVSKMMWLTMEECMEKIRHYCYKKKQILECIHRTLEEYNIVCLDI